MAKGKSPYIRITGGTKLELSKMAETAFDELLTQANNRATGVLGGALVDDYLQLALTCQWRQDPVETVDKNGKRYLKNVLSEFTDAGGPFTLSVKISMAYLTRLVGPEVYRDLLRLRDIRNRFAHRVQMDQERSHKPVTFETQSIKANCDNLITFKGVDVYVDGAEMPTETAKQKYLAFVVVLCGLLDLYSLNPTKEKKIVDIILKR
jgi:hypothetical protein